MSQEEFEKIARVLIQVIEILQKQVVSPKPKAPC